MYLIVYPATVKTTNDKMGEVGILGVDQRITTAVRSLSLPHDFGS